MANIYSPLPYDFYTRKPLEVKFSGLDLSSDAGLLLVRQAEQRQQICLVNKGCPPVQEKTSLSKE